MAAKDRSIALMNSNAANGIDFVEVVQNPPGNPPDLRVHFVNAVALGNIGAIATIGGGDSVRTVAVKDVAPGNWGVDTEGQPLLTLHCKTDGDFSNYTLRLNIAKLDLDFNTATFSFKVFCPSDFDCQPPPAACPPDDTPLPPIDYLAKDFGSFRRALSDFSALRYPQWRERSEADFGVMFMEALSALADDLSYQQDRIAAEAALDTASERRSVTAQARLVDYEPKPAICARAFLVCRVAAGVTSLPIGIGVSAAVPDGASIPFEIGNGLNDPNKSYDVNDLWNNPIKAYWLDDKERCLPRAATAMWIEGTGHKFKPGQALLIDTAAAVSADPPLRQIVHLIATDPANLTHTGEETVDPLFGNAPITRIAWREPLGHARDLTRTVVQGNIVPATQGRRCQESFAIGSPPIAAPQMPVAFARRGPNSTPQDPVDTLRHCLANAPLGWLAGDDPDIPPQPEIMLSRPATTPPEPWPFKVKLIDAVAGEKAFCLEPARYRRIFRHKDGAPQLEYDGDGGDTIRFGAGDFGAAPNDKDVFNVTYRVGAGALGNVAAGAINTVDPSWLGTLAAVSNPLAAAGGADRETNEQVRRRAPQAFRARQYRAVLAQDYEAEAKRLGWVQQAGCTFRYTGSWFTVFTAVDPLGGEQLSLDRHTEVIELLNRRRLCGYESYVPPARYVSIDLDIQICARPDAFQGEVERGVLEALAPPDRSATGFFFADHFTFGTPLERSRLEAEIQKVPGVVGVLAVRYRRRAVVPDFIDLGDELTLASDEILRIDNDRNHPERGSIRLNVMGGR
jgi:Baseplate J-like protein